MIKNKYITVILIALLASVQLFVQAQTVIYDYSNIDLTPPKSEAQKEKERQDSIKAVNKEWSNFFSETNSDLEGLYEKLNLINPDSVSKVKEYEIEFNIIKTRFERKEKKGEWCDSKKIDDQYDEYQLNCGMIDNKIKELLTIPPKKETNWLLIFGAAGGVLLMAGLPLIMQISAKYTARKQQKESEWRTITVQYMQIPQNLDASCIPLIQNLILMCENFIEKKPKKMHRGAALQKIKELKIKQLKIGKKININ